jgi:hypothetical protein
MGSDRLCFIRGNVGPGYLEGPYGGRTLSAGWFSRFAPRGGDVIEMTVVENVQNQAGCFDHDFP